MAPKRFIILLAALGVIALAGTAYYKMSHDSFSPNDGKQLTDAQVKEVTTAVGKHLMLPSDEDPLVAKVVEADKLKASQAFYKDAQNGDMLIVYPKAGKAILYRPGADVLVNVGPIVVDQNAQQNPAASQPSTSDDSTATDTEQPAQE